MNFLRPKPTYSTPYSNTAIAAPVNDFTTSTTPTNTVPTSSPSILRRPRAGTMPSFILNPMVVGEQSNNRPSNNSPAAFLLTTIEQGRHRSGSLNLPPPPSDAGFWSTLGHNGPLSPSSEQLLQNDSDFSIARTMRSLGLEDDPHEKEQVQQQQQNESSNGLTNSLFHHQSPPEFHMPSRSLLSGNNRNRSYSVNATARYEPEVTLSRTNSFTKIAQAAQQLQQQQPFASPLEGFTRQQQNRPRASSMGRADAGRFGSSSVLSLPPSMLWNSEQRSSPLVSSSMREEQDEEEAYHSLSLGDSELLANIMHSSGSPSTESNNTPVYDQQHDMLPSMNEVSVKK